MKRFSDNSNLLRLLAGWCGLLLYVVAFSPFGASIIAVLGTLDVDHRAYLQPKANGMRLVLHHEVVCSSHEHHFVAKALAIISQPTSEADPDHVIQFGIGDGFWRDLQQSVVVSGDLVERGVAANGFSVLLNNHRSVRALPPMGTPPDVVGNLLNIRSTVLQI